MTISQDQYARIYDAWRRSVPPMQVANVLRLNPKTVIRRYVELDDIHQMSFDAFDYPYEPA
jgi:hypothetical protein